MTGFTDRARMPGAAQTGAGGNRVHRARPHVPRPPWAPVQLKTSSTPSPASAAAPNRTGLPDRLKAGVEALSGLAMDDVRVHRNSTEPAKLGALAYAKGTDIHLGPGQERHLPHEAWHVVQQAQGRVRANVQLSGGIDLSDDPALESEADREGATALAMAPRRPDEFGPAELIGAPPTQLSTAAPVVQRLIGFEFETPWLLKAPANSIGMHTPVIRGTRWSIVPDRADFSVEQLSEMGVGVGKQHVGHGMMEFVTEAFAENDVGVGGGLDRAMTEITAVGERLENAPRGLANRIFGRDSDVPLSRVVQLGGVSWGQSLAPQPLAGEDIGSPGYQVRVQDALAKRENILVRRRGGLWAAPQMTGGIKHDNLLHLLERMSGPEPLDPGQQARPSNSLMGESQELEITVVEACVGIAQTVAHDQLQRGALLDTEEDAYAGFIALLGTYVRLAHEFRRLSYDKAITPLLSRTNFGQFPLPLVGRTDFGELPFQGSQLTTEDFINDVLLVSGRYGEGEVADMAGQGNDKLFYQPGRHDAVTSRRWVAAIAAGHDPISWGQDQAAPQWQPQPVGAPGNQAAGHVYEFRRLEKGVELADWRQYALEMADLVVRANSAQLE